MKTIYKYPFQVTDRIAILTPAKAQILSVQVQDGTPCIWAMVDPQNEKERRIFEIFGTGHEIREDMGISRIYVGTFQMHNGSLVWHLFERLD